MTSKEIFWFILLVLVSIIIIFESYNKTKIEHEKTIQKAIECGYQPISIGGDYWNKGD